MGVWMCMHMCVCRCARTCVCMGVGVCMGVHVYMCMVCGYMGEVTGQGGFWGLDPGGQACHLECPALLLLRY